MYKYFVNFGHIMLQNVQLYVVFSLINDLAFLANVSQVVAASFFFKLHVLKLYAYNIYACNLF